MICKKCGQEIIDTKEFCVSCGTRLIKEKKAPKKLIIFVLIGMVVMGILLCYFIINYNTEKEIKPYLKEENNAN